MVTESQLTWATIRQRNAGNPGVSADIYSWSVMSSYPWGHKCLGSERTLDPIASGKFIPGQLRLNDVTIEKGMGFCNPTDLATRWSADNLPSSYLDGDYAAYISQYSSRARPGWPTEIAQQCLDKAKSKFNDADADIALMLAELTQTLELLRDPSKALVKILCDPRYKVPHKGLKAAAALWLQFRMAVMPLISDIESLIELYTKQVAVLQHLVTKKSGYTWDSDTTSSVSHDAYFVRVDVVSEVRIKHRCFAHVYADVTIVGDAPDFKRFGFSPSQFLALAWELAPYSFVVDWFLSVGNWLRALTPPSSVTFLGACASYVSDLTYTVELKNPIVSPSYAPYWYLTKREGGKFTFTLRTLQRKVLSTTPALPTFTLEKLNFFRALDSLALIIGKFKSWR